tara:strand:- start:4136 stop:4678 length:543 start_codon:yes stop_codon:yes gene_type:complete
MKANLNYFIFFVLITYFHISFAEEMIFGEETISPGMKIVFEAAPKDTIFPEKYFLDESSADLHIEMLINWSEKSPTGSPIGGFIPYLDVTAIIEAQNGNSEIVKLTPHINIIDNFHYAQNIKLPGKIDEFYKVTIIIKPPLESELGIHYDWKEKYGYLLNEQVFTYTNLSFKEIALKSRR